MPCFIRRNDSNGWVAGQEHHGKALSQFLQTGDAKVTIPHSDGGDFIAEFRIVQKTAVTTLCNYIDQQGNSVQIMDSPPEYIAYINRIVGW
jgi:hypothetical protein